MITCIAIRRPIKYEVENCEQITLTSKFDWDTYGKGGSSSKVEAQSNIIELVLESFEGTYPISSDISGLIIGSMIYDTPVFHNSNNTEK